MIDQTILQGIPDHRGQPRPPGPIFFAAPPASIGQLISAESTLGSGRIEFALPVRIGLAAAVVGIIFYGGMLVAAMQHPDDRGIYLFFTVVLAALGAAGLWYNTGFNHNCTYVGQDGFARFRLKRNRDGTPVQTLLLFRDAAALLARQTHSYTNHIYTHTSYSFRWMNDAGRYVARLDGKYRGEHCPPKAGDAFHFAAAAEIAWSEHVLARAQQQLQQEGSIAFRVDHNRVVRVGPNFLEFHFGEAPVRVNRQDIGSVTLGNGFFSFKHKDAKWYGNAGKYRFAYGDMANGKVFLFALDRLMGYRWNAAA